MIKKYITYTGIENPSIPSEVKVEIYGLKNVIKIAEQLISELEQVLVIVELEKEKISDKNSNNKE
jgi:hypothetical protein